MGLRISIADRAAIVAHAAASADEVCGLLLGTGACVARVVACANVSRAPATRFELDPAALIAAHRATRGGGAAVIGHYHSHPSGRAEPSPTDAREAAADGAIWIVVAGTMLTAWRAVATGRLHGRFDPVEIVAGTACTPTAEPPQGRIRAYPEEPS